MKSIISIFLLSLSSLAMNPIVEAENNENLKIQLDSDLVFQKMVKVYNYEGALICEFTLDDVANNKISILDHLILEQSDFAFDYQGDYYYFGSSIDKTNVLY